MQNKIQQTVIAGIGATAVMTAVMLLGGAMGMPKMSPPHMLSSMMGVPVFLGWLMHFMIGAIFAAGYIFFFNRWLRKIHSKVLKGVIFGVAVFIFAQIAIPILQSIFSAASAPPPGGSMVPMLMGGIIGHVIFGITVALIVPGEAALTEQIVR
jgi:hypothetical protein